MTRTVEILPDRAALVDRARVLVLDQIQSAIAERGFCTLVLAGGSTPKPLYEALAQEDLPWDKLYIFWGDERYVSPDHPDSNAGMAKQAWLDRVAIPSENVYPMPTDASDPAIAAAQYDQQIQTFFKQKANQTEDFPAFDLVLLGMGDDGHTASLFPHTEAIQVCDRRVTVGNKDSQPRLTLTVPILNCARTLIFMVTGANKQTALAQVFAPEPNYEAYPASLIQPQAGKAWWLLDQAAGAGVDATA